VALYLTEADVNGLLTMDLALDALDEVFKARAAGEVGNIPRARLPLGSGSYNIMAASWVTKGVVGHKSYTGGKGGATFHVMIYDASGDGLLAVMEAGRLGQVRTGAASGLATRYMARPDASVVGVIGAGYQAETQVEAVARARNVSEVRVFSRTAERREAFAKSMSERLQIPMRPVDTAAAAAEGADILIAITNSFEPVITADMLAPGMHVNAAGGNSWMRRELETAAVARADVIATDDIEQARIECGELIRAADTGHFSWDSLVRLDRIVAGQRAGRESANQVTLFESQGVAFEDVAVAERLYKLALGRGVGTELPG
jgi:ornithine cyclodeaminase/alanine dehydrogenase-like protein (mu-crystallin family)